MAKASVILPVFTVLERCADLIKSAGFEMRDISRTSESRYFALPGRKDLLRLSSHPVRAQIRGLDRVAAKLTIRGRKEDDFTTIRIDPDKIPGIVALTIGRYMIESGLKPQIAPDPHIRKPALSVG